MFRLILALVAASAIFVKIDAQGTPAVQGRLCPVGESLVNDGFCNLPQGDAKCAEYCTKKFGGEVAAAACSAERPGTKKRECICTLRCASGGCWGDPHCWSFDNSAFGYQGLQKYYVVKPCKKLASLPQFEVIQLNHPYGAGPAAVLDTLYLTVAEWGQIIEVKIATPTALTVNRKPQAIPYRFSRFVKHREDFIDVSFTDATMGFLVITTSFGLRITVANNGGSYGDLQVDIPRHPELRSNTCGILGLWDDNPANDNIDSKGKPQILEPGFSPEFGNSWLVPGGQLPTQCEIDLAKMAHDDHIKNFPKEEAARLRKMCEENLEQAELLSCLKDLQRPPHAIDDCVLDMSHIKDENDQKAFLKAMVGKFIQACPDKKIKFKEPRDSCCLENLVNLYRFNGPSFNNHIYTADSNIAMSINKNQPEWVPEGITARVASTGSDCHCNPNGFVPVYHMYRPPVGHFDTSSLAEAKAVANVQLYTNFYCSAVQGESGATVPLYRFTKSTDARGADIILTTNKDEAGANAIIVCYVWPLAPAVKEAL